ncbi:hypothetical protein EWM64_g8318 [Hericium alpestre]|uniref:Peptidase C14 caspase domain-containing protein n=1 Tax=Hericium alpestre TaxID=135208 RepID=A0A4Y9ZNW9_9AGAM|nr:hypothetical protein EWM64_g8318 [Hericium alpestre]
MPPEQHVVPRPFGGDSYIAESDQPEERQLIAAVLTVTDAQIRLLEDFERSLWAERHPGLELDCDLLLKEVQRTVQSLGEGTPVDWDILQKLDALHHLRRERTMRLGCLAASLHPFLQLPPVFPSGSQSSLEHPTHGSRFWAVIIGINVYDDPSIPRLRGCVPDALAMHTYLTHDLCVPPDHICLLTQSEGDQPPVWAWPTRQNILSALYMHLRDNPRIRTGDHMLIYFSGHGSAYYASDAFASPAARVGSIEALCPSDRGTHSASTRGISSATLATARSMYS